MVRKVVHMFQQRGYSNGTLCGRSHETWHIKQKDDDGANVTSKQEEVTCKFCLKKLDSLSSFKAGVSLQPDKSQERHAEAQPSANGGRDA
jgi:hypothetical protein